MNICALSNFEITHLGINAPPPPPSPSCSSSSFRSSFAFLSFTSHQAVACRNFCPPFYTLPWSYPPLALILVCVSHHSSSSFFYLPLILSFIVFDLYLYIHTTDLRCFTPVSPSAYPALILPFIGLGLGFELTPEFSLQRFDKCELHLPCLLSFDPFLSSFMLLTGSVSSDISSSSHLQDQSPQLSPPPPLSTFIILLTC